MPISISNSSQLRALPAAFKDPPPELAAFRCPSIGQVFAPGVFVEEICNPHSPMEVSSPLTATRVSVTMSDMKTISVRTFERDPSYKARAAGGESFLVTLRGRPHFRVLPPEQPETHLGAGRHLAKGKPVSPEPIPASEWKGLDR